MYKSEYINIYEHEDTYWWYQGTYALVTDSIRRWSSLGNPKVCDAGCGTGGLLERLMKTGFTDVCGFDFSDDAIEQLEKRKWLSGKVYKGDIEKIPLADSSFDVVTCIDVLYHSGVKREDAALREIFRILKPNGILILQLAAFEFLRGSHDLVVMAARRYRVGEVEELVKKAGFKIEFCSYRNIWLFPIMFVWRITNKFRVKRKKLNSSSDLFKLPKAINTLLYMVVKIENYLLNRISFLFGTSVFCVARKERD